MRYAELYTQKNANYHMVIRYQFQLNWSYSKAEFFPDLATKERYYSGNDTYLNAFMIRI